MQLIAASSGAFLDAQIVKQTILIGARSIRAPSSPSLTTGTLEEAADAMLWLEFPRIFFRTS
jgi:hypothetical protein